ncbi:MAG: hypothetical protein IK038_14395 [Bacteroidaceae bacterium]|nr:hypothetical protein [Bacteroidaceae bacterium]MBR4794796.1 hypothetical protein [Bacteroidaceae bacterium]
MPKGDYNAATTYELLDLVTYQNSSYIAKGTTTGNLPTDYTYWQLSAYGGNIANLTENFAEIETSTIAQNPHPEGDIFVDADSNLVRATAQINVNDPIAIGTNCARTTVEALINSFNDSFIRLEADKEISTQTDLDTVTTYGNYYKSSTLFYVTNAPTGIDSNPLSIFRLTVIKGPGASDVIQSIVCDDGKTYKRGYNGTTWSSWVEFATTSVIGALDTRLTAAETDIDNLETSRLKTYTADSTAWDTAPTAASTKPVTSGGVKTALDNKLATYAGDATAWDTTPTANSTKPVTSGGIKTEIDKKLPTYASGASSWDTTPTASSTKPVTSGGVKTQIDTINGNKANQTVIATRQANLVASRRYEIGEQFIYNNTLYKATQIIAANTNINTGSGGNATTADNVTTQISNLANMVSINVVNITSGYIVNRNNAYRIGRLVVLNVGVLAPAGYNAGNYLHVATSPIRARTETAGTAIVVYGAREFAAVAKVTTAGEIHLFTSSDVFQVAGTNNCDVTVSICYISA